MVTDVDRRELFQALEGAIGAGPAGTMMELLPPVEWSEVAKQSDLVALRGEMAGVRGEMAELRGEMAELRAKIDGDMAELRAKIDGDVAQLRGEMAELRAKIDGQIPRFILANIPIMVSLSGLVLAAAKLA